MDSRFAKLGTDPRFIRAAKKQNKIQLDDRFSELFKKKGKGKAAVDKYGRPSRKDAEDAESLARFYSVETPAGEASAERDPEYAIKVARGEILLESSDEEEADVQEDSDEEQDDQPVELGPGARGRRNAAPLSESEDDYNAVNLNEDDEVVNLDEDENEAEPEEIEINSKRLAAVNLDWDHIRAVDLYKVFSSVFASTSVSVPTSCASNLASGSVVAVSIYPSQFGKERMAREEREGPPKEIFAANGVAAEEEEEDSIGSDDESVTAENIVKPDDGNEYNERALRRYQLERLRYNLLLFRSRRKLTLHAIQILLCCDRV